MSDHRNTKRQKTDASGSYTILPPAPIRMVLRLANALCESNEPWTEEQWSRARRFALYSTFLSSARVHAMDQRTLCAILRRQFPSHPTAEDAEAFAMLSGVCSDRIKDTKPLLQNRLLMHLDLLVHLGIDADTIRQMTKRQLCETLSLIRYNGRLRTQWSLQIDTARNLTQQQHHATNSEAFWKGEDYVRMRAEGKRSTLAAKQFGMTLPEYELYMYEQAARMAAVDEDADTEEDEDEEE